MRRRTASGTLLVKVSRVAVNRASMQPLDEAHSRGAGAWTQPTEPVRRGGCEGTWLSLQMWSPREGPG